ncbi:DUF2092 domain-containing protein [Massilia solisilvae]|uniref:DUF2092 domain-containing protein n=1 Tax=Massilia solisilvae TaxID=1811225 RepID=A0ABT2BHH5_9BURK|nr:DUF2092 domain-containing protein [Massilia solisilvae]MCS0607338.1 DUF2092 domain-containing protein [Massilia solisilvae]
MRRANFVAGALALAAVATLAGAGGQAPQQQPAVPAPAAPTESQAHAQQILRRMAAFLAGAPRFSVNVASNYDVLQVSGQKIEFGERRSLVVQRPDRLRVDTARSDGAHTSAVFTGAEMVLVDATRKVYASTAQPGGLDQAIVHFVSDLGMRFPLAMMLVSRLPAELERRVRSIDYVERSDLFGVPTHHLAARGDTVDFQVWVRDDDAHPLPLRVVLTYKDEPGQPEFRAQFSDWNLEPAITAMTFQPSIPAGAQKVLFEAQLAAARAAGQGRKP